MPDFIPYSEKQQILPVEVWERERCLDLDCQTAKVATATVRAIVSRLLSIDKTGKCNVDDFEFIVFDNDQPNAEFVSDKKTLNHKNVIAITTGIQGLCKNEDELAGILAHELGHYTYHKIYGENNNTVFQERFSDLHALDLMIAAGYNPVAYSNVCETMRGHSSSSFFDVHGSSMARKEDVDAYLTKLHKEQGFFKVGASTGLWGDFSKIINSHTDVYKSYFRQLLENNFPEMSWNPFYQPSIKRIFDLILSEMKKGRFTNYQRVKDMVEYLEKEAPAKLEIKSTQTFLEQVVDFCIQNPSFGMMLPIDDLCRALKSKFRGDKPFEVFPPIDQEFAKIDEFKTTRDPVRAEELARYLMNSHDKIFSIYSLTAFFNKQTQFKMPLRAIAKGHTMPTDWLYSVYNESVRRHERSVIVDLIQAIGFDCEYEWITDKTKGFYADEYSGKILATGKKEVEKVKAQRQRQNEYQNKHESFNDFMCAINLLYEFNQGNISAGDVVNRLEQHGKEPGRRVLYDMDSFVYWLDSSVKLIDYKHENTFLKSEIQELNNSKAFAEIYIKPFLAIIKTALQQVAPKLASQIQLDKPPHDKTWLEYLQYVFVKFVNLKRDFRASSVLEEKVSDALYSVSKKMGYQDDGDYYMTWNVELGPVVRIVTDVYMEKLHSLIMNFVNAAIKEKVYSESSAARILLSQLDKSNRSGDWHDISENEIINVIQNILKQQVIPQLQSDIVENSYMHLSKGQWLSSNLTEELDEEIKQKTDLHKIQRLLYVCDMLPNNEQELLEILYRPTPQLKRDGYSLMEVNLKQYLLTYYIRKKMPITNLYSLLIAIKSDKVVNLSDNFIEEFSDYIDSNGLMPTDFKGLYDLHAVMQKLNIFSKEKFGYAKMLDLLISHIEKMPQPLCEIYSWNLLSGFYYGDDSALRYLNRNSTDIGSTVARQKLIEIYSDAVAQRLGRDDSTPAYFAKIQELTEFINQKHIFDTHAYLNRVGINKVTQGKLYRLISDKIQSQEHVSKFLANDKNVVLSDADAQSKDLLGRGIEELLDILDRYKNISLYSIEFLNRKLTQKSIDDYRKNCISCVSHSSDFSVINPSGLENFYHTFWSSGLEVRAIIMNKLLNRAFKTLDEKIKYVCDMNFDKDNKYRKDAEMICDCVIKSFEPYEQDLILAAIASADENKQEGQSASRSVGEGLRMFFENMGPAWVKFGQLLSYVPDLPSEIRRDLAKLKDRADMPARWDVYTWMHEAMPQELYNRIERVEDIVGAGSFWMTAIVQLKNDKGKTEKKVVQLLRPNADARADSGFKTIELAIKKLAKQNSSYQILQEVALQAHRSAKYEVDVEIGNKQYEKAKELYGDINVNIEGTQYTPHVADWRYYGTGKNGMSYKIMDYAEGATLSRVYASDDERRKMALAYFTIEMVNLFKGDVWDIDRHQGQQNFDVVSPTNVNINIYDTGAQLPTAPDRKNKILFANIFFDLIQEIQSGKSIDSYLLKIIKHLDKLQNTLHIDVSYVSNIQKGLMALSDIIEYQKEIKDADGNIIQKRLTLSAEDLKHAIVAVLQNPSVDQHIGVVIKGRVVAAKLKHMDIQGLKDLLNNQSVAQDNPVEITIADREHESQSSKFNKVSEEIAALDNPDDYILGIPKKHVDQQNKKQPLVFDPYQKVA